MTNWWALAIGSKLIRIICSWNWANRIFKDCGASSNALPSMTTSRHFTTRSFRPLQQLRQLLAFIRKRWLRTMKSSGGLTRFSQKKWTKPSYTRSKRRMKQQRMKTQDWTLSFVSSKRHTRSSKKILMIALNPSGRSFDLRIRNSSMPFLDKLMGHL